MKLEPRLHSHIEDALPGHHPLALTAVVCAICGDLLHASNNECMRTWVETGKGNFCIKCFAGLEGIEDLEDEYGLA
jgi:hypothetical protein